MTGKLSLLNIGGGKPPFLTSRHFTVDYLRPGVKGFQRTFPADD